MKIVQEIRDAENNIVCTATNSTEAADLWKVFCRMVRKQQKATILFVSYDEDGQEIRSTVGKRYRPRAKKGA